MDSLTFLSKLIDALLSWPVIVLIIVWMFRKPLTILLPKLKNVNLKEGTAEFQESMTEVSKEAEQALPQPPAPLKITVHENVRTSDDVALLIQENAALQTQVQEEFLKRAELHPAATILQSWLNLEVELRAFAKKHNITDSQKLPTSRIGAELLAKSIWNDATFKMFATLRNTRNAVVHTPAGSITPAQALIYDEIVRRLITKLREDK